MAEGDDFRKSCNHDEGADPAPNNLGKKNEESNEFGADLRLKKCQTSSDVDGLFPTPALFTLSPP